MLATLLGVLLHTVDDSISTALHSCLRIKYLPQVREWQPLEAPAGTPS